MWLRVYFYIHARAWGGKCVVVMLSVVEASARKFVVVSVPLLEILHYVQDDKVVLQCPLNITGIIFNIRYTVGVRERVFVMWLWVYFYIPAIAWERGFVMLSVVEASGVWRCECRCRWGCRPCYYYVSFVSIRSFDCAYAPLRMTDRLL